MCIYMLLWLRKLRGKSQFNCKLKPGKVVGIFAITAKARGSLSVYYELSAETS